VGASELERIYATLGARVDASPQADAVHRVGWRDRLQQSTYFAALVEIGVRDDSSVLDVGCGHGDLYAFLNARGFRGPYTGVDLSPELIASARERFPAAHFVLGDVLESALDAHDYVMASGLFDYRTSDSPVRLRATLRRMFALARLGLAWNMFAVAPPGRPDLYHEPVGDLLAFCDELTPFFSLRRDYDPSHLTVCLYQRNFFMTDGLVRLIGRLYLEPTLRADVKQNPARYAQDYQITFQQLNAIASLLEE
jgi:SAM-dependent methyltransferase